MAKDDNMPNKKEITHFLAHVEQLTEEDGVFKDKLGSLLRKLISKQATHDANLRVPMNGDEPKANERIVYKDKIVEKIVEKRVEVPVERVVEKRVEVTPQWAKSLESEFTFLKQVQAQPELANILLPNGDDNVLQLIAIAAQWNNVLRVWDALATQVKHTKHVISSTEQQILEHSLALFNLTLQSNQATLQSPELGASYDYDSHQKVSGSGGNIEQILLAGLYNAAGEKARSAVVSTR